MAQSVILMACAELDENALPLSTHDSGEGDQKVDSRVTLLDLRKTFALEAASVELEKIGEWCVDASSECIALIPTGDGRQ